MNFITNHGRVALYLREHPRTTMIEVSRAIGIVERSVARIINGLIDEEIVVKWKAGQSLGYEVFDEALEIGFRPLRLPKRREME